ncbi:MAG: helix-turn-helix domain-containing protein [Bacteroidota bacterium]
MQPATNPFQVWDDKLSRIETNQEKIIRMLAEKSAHTQPEKELPVNIDEAVKITGLAKATIYSKFSRREIPGYRRGQKIYFYPSELLSWIRSGKRQTMDEIKQGAVESLVR